MSKRKAFLLLISSFLAAGLVVLIAKFPEFDPFQVSVETRSVSSRALTKKIRLGSWELEDLDIVSEHNLRVYMERFVREPHPMGSPANRALARDMEFLLRSFGWQTRLQSFTMPAPNIKSARFGGKESFSSPVHDVSGENLIGFWPGKERCVILLGGHYDTKLFNEFKFVGANDGGSSTVLMLELARLMPKIWKKNSKDEPAGKWRSCAWTFVFFDGEEAILPGWYDGARAVGVRDHLYGSRAFVRSIEDRGGQFLKRDLELVVVIDMVGHKNQNLFLTKGSDPEASDTFLRVRGETPLKAVPFEVNDDHDPFRESGFRVVHIIDWTNLTEWHTPADTPEIISFSKLASFGQLLLRFYDEPRVPQGLSTMGVPEKSSESKIGKGGAPGEKP